MLMEIMGIKTNVINLNTKVESIQEENAAWKQKLGLIDQEVGEVKVSLEMAHNLIADEKADRITAMQEVKMELTERKKENSNTLQLVKNQNSQIKSLNDSVRKVTVKLDEIDGQHENLLAPMKQNEESS